MDRHIQIDDLALELRRVVDRLDSMPLNRAASAGPACREAALLLIARTRDLTDEIPAEAMPPELGPQGLGSMIAVLGCDYVNAARASGTADLGLVLDALVELRRALP
jgi:hypothetical protein